MRQTVAVSPQLKPTDPPADGGGGEPVKALYLHVSPDPIYTGLHEPTGPRSGIGVVLCPPFGWEDMCSYRARRDWAERLAADGHLALRVDLPGTGDSAGGPTRPDRLGAWTEAISAAADWLRGVGGCRRVVALGIGLGGAMAWCAAARGAAIDDLVLWGVPARGRKLVRELKTFARLEAAQLPATGDWQLPVGPEGTTVSGGYLLTPETLDALGVLDLAQLPLPEPGARRMLLLDRDGLAVDSELVAALDGTGTAVDLAPGKGFGEMMAEPHFSRTPIEVLERVAAWLRAVPVEASARVPRASVAHSETLELDVGGTRVRERAIAVDHEIGRLFGIVSEPADGPTGTLSAVLLGGTGHRIGPNRMWVEMARRWAAQGITAVRLDLGGVGDADGERPVDVAALYRPEPVDQTVAALDALEREGLPPSFVLTGLCASASWAFTAAAADDRVRAAFMINPGPLVWDPEAHLVRERNDLRRKALSRAAWGRVLRGEVSFRRPLRVARGLLLRILTTASPVARLAGRRQVAADPPEDQLTVTLDRMRDARKTAVLLFVGHEPYREELEREGILAREDTWPNLDVTHVAPGAEVHTIKPIVLQREVHALLDAKLAHELSRSGGGS
jgi:dienelactone hydrolase